MSVFDGNVKVGRKLSDPGTDKTLPPSGGLSFGAIKSPTALASTIGIDTKLVHGDRWQQIHGSHTENVNMNVMTTIQGNQDVTTTGNVTRTTVGNANHTVVGAELHTNVGVQNHTRLAPRVEVYAGSENKDEPDTHFHSIENWFRSHDVAAEITAYKIEATIAAFEVKGYHLDIAPIKTEWEQIKDALQELEAQAVMGMKLYAGALRNEILAMALVARLTTASINPEVHLPPEAMIGLGPR